MTDPLLTVDRVAYSYTVRRQRIVALEDVSLVIEPGEVVCLNGQSGSGKSTLITLGAGLDVAAQGSVKVHGRDLAHMSRKDRTEFRLHNIGVVFQDHNLVPQFTARENVLLVLQCQGNNDPSQATELLDAVGIAELADRRAFEMSGGQKQRIGIARAVAGNRKLLLCDEPTGSLDRANADRVFAVLADIAHSQGVGVVIASHDPVTAQKADRTVTLQGGRLAHAG